MANAYGLGRTNYVRVRDRAVFDAWIESVSEYVTVDVYEQDDRIALSGYGSDDGDLPSWYEVETSDGEYEERDFMGEFIADHLHPDDVLICMSVSHEKARYASGGASAHKVGRDDVYLHLGEIYNMAAEAFGVEAKNISEATY